MLFPFFPLLLCGASVSQKQAQKLSGLQHKTYVSAYQTVEKLLNLSSQVGLRELAVKFGCLEAEKLAEEILKRFAKSETIFNI